MPVIPFEETLILRPFRHNGKTAYKTWNHWTAWFEQSFFSALCTKKPIKNYLHKQMKKLLHKTWPLSKHVIMCYCFLFQTVITVNTKPSQRKLAALTDTYPAVTQIYVGTKSAAALKTEPTVSQHKTPQCCRLVRCLKKVIAQLCCLWCRHWVHWVCVSLCIWD